MITRHGEFERITNVTLPFDMRSDDPKTDFGCHGLDMFFTLKGRLGAITFQATAFSWLPSVTRSMEPYRAGELMGVEVSYHSPSPRYPGQLRRACDWVPGGQCYSDGSMLLGAAWGEQIFAVVGQHPETLLWAKLEARYDELFKQGMPHESAGLGETLKEAFDVLLERTD